MEEKKPRKKDRKASVISKRVIREIKKSERRKKYFTQDDQLSRLQKYDEIDKKNPYYKAFQGDAAFRGPKGNSSIASSLIVLP